MKFLLDEGVPVSVGSALSIAGHDVVFFNNSGLSKGSPDPVVCAAAESHDAVLVAADSDMKKLAKGHGITPARFKTLGLVRFECPKTIASSRIEAALSHRTRMTKSDKRALHPSFHCPGRNGHADTSLTISRLQGIIPDL